MEKMFELDFSEEEKGWTSAKEDSEFLTKVLTGIVHREDSLYEVPLPLEEENSILPDNRRQAEQRLQSLKKRLLVNYKYRYDCANVMDCIMDKGYVAEINDEYSTLNEGYV